MVRRQLLGTLGAGVGVVALGGRARAQDHDHAKHDGHLETIGACAKICNEASHHCLDALAKGGEGHAEHHAKAHQAAMDCQEFCVLTATLMARSSPYAKYAHQACADACRDCAAACEGHEDELMKDCIAACRECEKVCRSMAGGTR